MSVRRVTVATLAGLKARNERAVFVTAYDYPTAPFAARAGVDMILVGDSAAMTMLGLPSTLQIGLDEMLVFIRAVTRAAQRAFVIGDLPFMSYQPSDETAVRSAGAFVAAGCDAVKCEGGARVAPRVRAMVDAGIAVMGHLGLTPQSLGQLGGPVGNAPLLRHLFRPSGSTSSQRYDFDVRNVLDGLQVSHAEGALASNSDLHTVPAYYRPQPPAPDRPHSALNSLGLPARHTVSIRCLH